MSTHHHIARTNGRNTAYSRARHRLRDIERIIIDRGGIQPDLVNIYLVAVATCFGQIRRRTTNPRPTSELLSIWCARWESNLADAHLDDFVEEAASGKYQLKTDDDFGRLLHLSDADRTRLGIKTIGAYDVGKAVRTKAVKARRRERDRLRAAAKRRAKGVTPRAIYEATSLSKAKPWEQAGVSKATFYRRKKTGETGASPHHLSVKGRRTSLTTPVVPDVHQAKTEIGAAMPPAGAVGTNQRSIEVSMVDAGGIVGSHERRFKTRFPTSMRLTKDLAIYARECGFDRERILFMWATFRDFSISERCYSLDWRRCWERWVDRQAIIDNANHHRWKREAWLPDAYAALADPGRHDPRL